MSDLNGGVERGNYCLCVCISCCCCSVSGVNFPRSNCLCVVSTGNVFFRSFSFEQNMCVCVATETFDCRYLRVVIVCVFAFRVHIISDMKGSG